MTYSYLPLLFNCSSVPRNIYYFRISYNWVKHQKNRTLLFIIIHHLNLPRIIIFFYRSVINPLGSYVKRKENFYGAQKFYYIFRWRNLESFHSDSFKRFIDDFLQFWPTATAKPISISLEVMRFIYFFLFGIKWNRCQSVSKSDFSRVGADWHQKNFH